jgi:hypothetical protein
MIRRVAFKKAVPAGVLGALVWEVAARLLIWIGLPLFDLVRVLGTMIVGDAAVWMWWPVGIVVHACVGAIWAVFYAYFFWSMFDLPPVVQGLAFSLLPALLAGLIMIPQMDLMHAAALDQHLPKFGFFASRIGWLGPATVLAGHLIYGAVMGGLYTRPVGYAVGRRIAPYG